VDTLGELLTLHITPADEDDREQVERLAEEIQQATGESVELAYVDQGYSGEKAAAKSASAGLQLEVVKHEEARRGFVLLPRRWVVECDFAWASRFRRFWSRTTRGWPKLVAGLHFVAFACLMLSRAITVLGLGP
jgi:transposase